MDETSGKVQSANAYMGLHKQETRSERSAKVHPTGFGKVRESSSNGVIEEYSGKVQKVSAHAARGDG